MTYGEAKRLLKVHGDDVYEQHKERLEKQRQELLEQVRKSSKKDRQDWEADLVLFDRALHILANHEGPKKLPLKKIIGICAAVLVVLVAGIAWSNIEADKKRAAAIQEKLQTIRPKFESAISERKWKDAESLLDELAAVDASAAVVVDGRKRIKNGLIEERRQQLAYYSGKIKASLETSDWVAAEKSLNDLTELDPNNEEISLLKSKIAQRKKEHAVSLLVASAQKAIDAKEWATADKALADLAEIDMKNIALAELRNKKNQALEKLRKDRAKSLELVSQAQSLDNGRYNADALSFLREAMRLNAENSAAKDLFEKMSRYTRKVNVPGDYKTLKEALANANPQDQISLGEGVFKGPFTVPPGVEIIGAGKEKTTLECNGAEGSVIDLTSAGQEVVLSKLRIQHETYDYSASRFAVVNVAKGTLKMTDCEIRKGSGHGVSVTEGGALDIRSCSVQSCGWNGIAVSGKGSKALVQATVLYQNFHHGAEAWEGGILTLDHCRAANNARGGVASSSRGQKLIVKKSILNENREAGVYVAGGVDAMIVENECNYNGIAGIFVRADGTKLTLLGNKAVRNSNIGIVLEEGLIYRESRNNVASGNRNRDLFKDAPLSILTSSR